ncbi:RICIN domain-containing protein [Kitasatospora sp. NPDC057512]|uniref:RICIN domain-containing protein n=1 Tax=Kitasatospora sp. NPDC057512 TaxID=3346154 RepID=UPI00367E8C0D
MTNPLRRRTARALRTLGAGILAALAGGTLLAAPASADTPPKFGWSDWNGWSCSGYYRINTPAGQVLDMSQGGTFFDGALIQYPWNGQRNQQWGLCRWPGAPEDTSSYVLRNRQNGDCIGSYDGGSVDASWISVFDCSGYIGPNQKFWKVVDPASGAFGLKLQHSGNWLAVAEAANANSIVAQYSYRATAFTLQQLNP